METNNTKRFWFFGRDGRLVVSMELRDFDEARSVARKTNREGAHVTLGRIEVISDAPVAAQGSVTAV